MKLNRITDVTKIIIFTATIILVCVLAALGFKMANEGKASVASGTNKYNAMASKQDDVELTAYDGSTILGSQIVDLIKKTIDREEQLAIQVITLGNKALGNTTGKYYNYSPSEEDGLLTISKIEKEYAPNTDDPKDRTKADYINPTSQFMGSVTRDANGNIIILSFSQIE
jgi:hypothetical protein